MRGSIAPGTLETIEQPAINAHPAAAHLAQPSARQILLIENAIARGAGDQDLGLPTAFGDAGRDVRGVTRRADPGSQRQIVSGIKHTGGVEPSVPVLL